MAFHVTSTPPVRSLHSPYSIPILIDKHLKPITSLAAVILTPNTTSCRASTVLLGLTIDTALWSVALSPEASKDEWLEYERAPRRGKEEKLIDMGIRWVSDIEALSRDALKEPELDQKAMTRYQEIDGRWAWLSEFPRLEARKTLRQIVQPLTRRLR